MRVVYYILIFILAATFKEIAIWLGLVLVILFTIDLIAEISKNPMPLKEVILISLGYQLLLTPFFFYRILDTSSVYLMEVSESTYFNYVVPAFSLLATGMNFFRNQYAGFSRFESKGIFRLAKNVIIIGIAGTMAIYALPGSLRYFAILISYFIYIGALMMIQSSNPFKKYWIAGVILFLFLEALNSGLFYNLLTWGFLFSLSFFYKHKLSRISKISFLIVGVLFVGLSQRVKNIYRQDLWSDSSYGRSNIALLMDSISKLNQLEFNLSSSDDYVRFNQGYILSRIMNYVPKHYPHTNGATILDGIYGALVPRIFDKNKAKVGRSGIYERFTGYKLHGSTSKDIGIFGESYANFGVEGAWLVVFCTGVLYSFIIKFFNRLSYKNPAWIFWLPLILFYAMRAEESYTPVLNNIVKASFVLWIFSKVHFNRIMSVQKRWELAS